MDLILLLVSAILIVLGVIGSFLPILPGPLTSWIGFLLFHLRSDIAMNWTFLSITLFFALLIWLLDYIIPILGTKRFGGSKAGMIGTTIGLIIGLIFPIPFGIILGPFLGALIGELVYNADTQTAIKAAFGSLLGFITSTFLKFVVAMIYLGLFIGKLFEFSKNIF
ncbi:MAG: DUF456 domain-containing protein [Flavobacteriaceae bacterium]|nr:DUF456 domain-containing protein [Flavobacteriaceae bacterium]